MQGEADISDGARIAEVLLPVAVDIAYSYFAPPALRLSPGDCVEVPLGTRKCFGVVWSVAAASGAEPGNLKSVIAKYDRPPLDETLRAFVDWVARWTLAPRGMALRLATRAVEEAAPETPRIGYRLAGPPPERMTAARARVIAAAEGGLTFPKGELAKAAACSAGVVDALVDEGTLEAMALPPEPVAAALDPGFAPAPLEAEQSAAAQALASAVEQGGYRPFLLEGVTGSGKTEVYFEAVAQALRAGGQALVLMPEIALTAQFLERFSARFGAKPAEWHSGVSERKRARVWRGVALGDVRVVAGARSALFLPFENLRLIVVDEEHEAAYKQEDGVAYHARDMAVVRARLEGAAIVLASATPSIETRVNAQTGRYAHLRLTARANARPMPQIEAIDMRREGPERGRWIAPRLVAEAKETIARGEQVLLFLNRRGYAPLTLCRTCGHRFECPNCSTWLVEHRFRGILTCHHCGHTVRRPDACPACGEIDALVACGPGIERIAEEAADLFPDARRLVLSSDLPGGTARMKLELAAVAAGECDIVIGTQILAKGHNFPLLGLVGVVDADLGLAHGDPRAAEKTFQLIQQVTGRAGRAGGEARAFLQTRSPDHPVLRAIVAGDRDGFYEAEVAERRATGMPPFGRLAGIVVSAEEREPAFALARAIALAAPGETDVTVLGPAEAPIAVVRGRHRFRLLLKTARHVDIQSYLRRWLAAAPPASGNARVQVDVDPQSFL